MRRRPKSTSSERAAIEGCELECGCEEGSLLTKQSTSRSTCFAHWLIRGRIFYCIDRGCSSRLPNGARLCRLHHQERRSHHGCVRCGLFPEAEAVIICPHGHFSHERCPELNASSSGLRSSRTVAEKREIEEETCSHCGEACTKRRDRVEKLSPVSVTEEDRKLIEECTTTTFEETSSAIVAAFAKDRSVFRRLKRTGHFDHRLRLGVLAALPRLLDEASRANEDEAIARLVGLLFTRAPQGPKEEERDRDESSLLSLAVSRSLPSVVRALRDGGASLHGDHLLSLREEGTKLAETIEALQMSHPSMSFGEVLMLQGHEATSPLQRLIDDGRWRTVNELLLHFSSSPFSIPSSLAASLPPSTPQSTRRTIEDAAMHSARGGKRILCHDLSGGRERFPVRVVNDVDDTTCESFTYTSRVLDTDGILDSREQSAVLYCDCTGACTSSCPCWSGAYEGVADGDGDGRHDKLSAWKNKRIRPDALFVPFCECSSACACSLHCGNRVAQKGTSFPVEVFRTYDGRGWALRSLCFIPRGAFIAEYTGELIEDEEANRREDRYLFETAVGSEKFTIDAHYVGNFSRFINHSCSPNAKTGLVSWEPQEATLHHVAIFAARNISAGEEITIHYGHSWWIANLPSLSCSCRSPSCAYSEGVRRVLLDTGVPPKDPAEGQQWPDIPA